MQGARIAETPDTKPASCWICHPPSQCHGRAFRGEGSVICTASPSSQHANPRLGTVHPQFHERPHGRPVHHLMTKFEGGTVTRVLRQTSRAARHSQHDEEMRGPAATRGEKVSTSLTWRKSGFSHITSRLGLAWISEAGLISGAPRNSSLDLSRCWNLPLSPRTDLTADLMASLWHTFFGAHQCWISGLARCGRLPVVPAGPLGPNAQPGSPVSLLQPQASKREKRRIFSPFSIQSRLGRR